MPVFLAALVAVFLLSWSFFGCYFSCGWALGILVAVRRLGQGWILAWSFWCLYNAMTTVCFTSLTEGRPSRAVTQAAFGQKYLAWLFGFLFLLLFWLALFLLSQSLFWSFVVGCLALGMDPFAWFQLVVILVFFFSTAREIWHSNILSGLYASAILNKVCSRYAEECFCWVWLEPMTWENLRPKILVPESLSVDMLERPHGILLQVL